MHLAPADHLHHGMAIFARLDNLPADFQTNLVDDSQDVALGDGGIRTHNEIRAGQSIEVGGVVGEVEGAVEQLAQHLGSAGWIDMVDRIHSFGTCHVVSLWANAADAVGEDGHFFNLAADAEALKAAQLGDLEVGVGDIAFLIQEDLDLAVTFETGDGVDRIFFPWLLSSSLLVQPGGFAGAQHRTSQVEAVEHPGRIWNAIQDAFDLIGVVAVDDRGDGSHQAGAEIDHPFCGTIAANAGAACRRAEGVTAAASGRTGA